MFDQLADATPPPALTVDQKIASGLSGEPIPFSIRSGAAENMNS